MDLKKDYEEIFYKAFSEYVDSNFNDIQRWVHKDEFMTVLERFPYDEEWNNSLFIWILKAISLLGAFSREGISNLMNEIIETVMWKNAEYGNSVFEIPLLSPETPVPTAILCRMSDKVRRFNALSAPESSPKFESVQDTLKDFIGYAVILWIVTYCDGYENKNKDNRLVLICPQGIKYDELHRRIENYEFNIVQAEN